MTELAECTDDFERYYPSLIRFARAVGAGVLPADDLVQEALVRHLTRRSARPDGRLDAYLRATIVNLVRSELRKRMVRDRIGSLFRSDEASTEDSYPSQALAMVATLAPTDRALLVLTVVDGLSTEEAGHQLGISGQAARARISRARRRLRDATDGDEDL